MIRTLEESDLPEVKTIIDSCFKSPIDLDALRHTLTCETCRTFINICDGQIMSVALLVEDSRLCWVASKIKRRGHTRELVGSIIKAHPESYLYVKQVNEPAIKLYESLGFSVTGTRDKSFRMSLKPKR